MSNASPSTIYFASPAEWRDWLARHHATAPELIVGFYKVATQRPSLTWRESVAEALCFGWIDSVRRSIDAERYTIRFTPRRTNSNWSAVNLRMFRELEEAGRMRPFGRAAFERRREDRSDADPPAQRPHAFEARHAARFRQAPEAWAFFQAQPASYRRAAIGWVASAKREATQIKRLTQLMHDSAHARRLAMLDRTPKAR